MLPALPTGMQWTVRAQPSTSTDFERRSLLPLDPVEGSSELTKVRHE